MDCLANNESIILSFKYSIKDKKHSIEHIFKTKNNNKKVIQSLFAKFEELSNLTWKELQNRPKKSGYETIPISQFKINLDSIKRDLELADDSKIIVFRFNEQNSRLLGVKSSKCKSILYIIGYDWDYSAYRH